MKPRVQPIGKLSCLRNVEKKETVLVVGYPNLFHKWADVFISFHYRAHCLMIVSL